MSWERSRHLPWTHIPISGENYERQKEQIVRQLEREASEASKQKEKQMQSGNDQGHIEEQQQKQQGETNSSSWLKGQPYLTSNLLKSAAFGGCIGSITGAVFGFMDSMRTAGDSAVLKKASNVAKSKYLLQGTSRSGALFGVFFGGFQVVKYGVRVIADPGQVGEIGIATAVSMGAMMSRPALRPSMPYGGMLIAMDAFSIGLREMDKL
mmetsp:Transcript_19632/g.25745  ORF Transcript_19632/g.25745 Transcript_19632/m.25745 type:complete len:209 (+) Transcript_19632:32-658(+)